jgi:hypothetical protein
MPLSKPIRRCTGVFIVAALALACLTATASARVGLDHNRPVGIGKARARATGDNPKRSPARPQTPVPGTLFKGSKLSDFWLAQSAPGAITEAPDPAGGSEGAFKMTVADQDVYPITPTENPRAELISPPTIKPGDEIWWSAKFFLPADFPTSTPNFVTLLQGPYGAPFNGTPPFHLEISNGKLKWQRNETYGWDVPWQTNVPINRWVSVMVHERFATEGFLELWIDGQPITFFAEPEDFNPAEVEPTTRLEMATIDATNDGGNGSIYLQSYRKAGMFQSLTVYQGPLTIGETRASVEG